MTAKNTPAAKKDNASAPTRTSRTRRTREQRALDEYEKAVHRLQTKKQVLEPVAQRFESLQSDISLLEREVSYRADAARLIGAELPYRDDVAHLVGDEPIATQEDTLLFDVDLDEDQD